MAFMLPTMRVLRSLAFGDRRYRYDASDDFNSTGRYIYDAAPACLLSAASGHPSISTGKERDTESGLDYFGARYFGSSMGRFMSPDWAAKAEPVPYAKLDNPQTLNLYAYVGNNPLSKTDPDGHFEAPWHFLITLAADIRTGHLLNAIPDALKTVWVDFRKGSQSTDPVDTELHSTSGTTKQGVQETAAQAQEGTAQLVDQAIAGDRPKSDALHAVEDKPAKDHEFGPWNGHLSLGHFLSDLFPSPGRVKEAFDNAVSVLQGKNPIEHTGETPPRSDPPAPPPQQQ